MTPQDLAVPWSPWKLFDVPFGGLARIKSIRCHQALDCGSVCVATVVAWRGHLSSILPHRTRSHASVPLSAGKAAPPAAAEKDE